MSAFRDLVLGQGCAAGDAGPSSSTANPIAALFSDLIGHSHKLEEAGSSHLRIPEAGFTVADKARISSRAGVLTRQLFPDASSEFLSEQVSTFVLALDTAVQDSSFADDAKFHEFGAPRTGATYPPWTQPQNWAARRGATRQQQQQPGPSAFANQAQPDSWAAEFHAAHGATPPYHQAASAPHPADAWVQQFDQSLQLQDAPANTQAQAQSWAEAFTTTVSWVAQFNEALSDRPVNASQAELAAIGAAMRLTPASDNPIETGRPADAVQCLARWAAAYQRGSDARLAQTAGEVEECLKALLAQSSPGAEAHKMLGLFFLAQRRYDEARACLASAVLRLAPEDPLLLMQLGRAAQGCGRPFEADPLLKQAVEAGNKQLPRAYRACAAAWKLLGQQLAAEGKFWQALGSYIHALSVLASQRKLRLEDSLWDTISLLLVANGHMNSPLAALAEQRNLQGLTQEYRRQHTASVHHSPPPAVAQPA
ncbi:hypothetical protein WJX72_012562 [[Myrmecia] bisecta]|uniref:Uncharacterized protein n=1 Tax=[Myrmecia] bisecta TaxID=41462 RepID=A0AAW1Q8F8_9CHLO